jgi:molybdopterin/thiamine biosynthesis adenylyltransferase
MYRIPLVDAQSATSPDVVQLLTSAAVQGHWSRSIAALGGLPAWNRLVDLRVAMIGCGRTGTLIATMLKHVGVQEIALVDPDRVELHNCGEMDRVDWHDIGATKVSVIAGTLAGDPSPRSANLVALAEPVDHPEALSLLKRADVIVCCADSDAARLTSAIIATLYHKVLIDVGTGVLYCTRVMLPVESQKRPTCLTHRSAAQR